MLKRKLFFIATTEDDKEDQIYLKSLSDYEVFSGPHEELIISPPQNLTAIIFSCGVMTVDQYATFAIVAKAFPNTQILVLAFEIPVRFYGQIVKFKNTAALQKKHSPDILTAVLKKIAGDEPFDDRQAPRFPRFKTDQPVRLLVLKTGLMIPSRTQKNYSAGGAALLNTEEFLFRLVMSYRSNLPEYREALPPKKSPAVYRKSRLANRQRRLLR